MLVPLSAAAYTPKQVQRGDSVTLSAPQGYRSYQWQVSSDNKAYYDIPSETSIDYRFTAFAPLYYRTQAVNKDGSKSYLDTFRIAFDTLVYHSTSQVSAAQGYVEVNGQPGSGINIPGDGRTGNTLQLTQTLTGWSNLNSHAVYYFHHPATNVDAQLLLTVNLNAVVQFCLRVYDPTHMEEPIATTYISMKGSGKQDTLNVFMNKFPKNSFYRYDLQCLKGNSSISNINRWRFLSTATSTSYAGSYLSSPSVHLSGWKTTRPGAPTGKVFDWCYEEIMIPESSNYSGTYAMSLGVLQGYMGIQVNDGRHDVIFSMWDDGSTDVDPGLASYKKAGAVDASDFVTVSRFGNEGTGVKTFAAGQFWKPGQYVQFITNARPETATYEVTENGVKTTITRQNTLVSAWFNSGDGKGWRYMATTRLPGSGHYFDSWYSFLENYSWTSGQILRKAYYRNGYIHGLNTKKWYHCNQVSFGHTDGGTSVGSRTDYGQGKDTADASAFFMQSGAYLPTYKTESSVTLRNNNTPVDTIDIAALEARVDLAIAKEEAALKEAEEFSKSILDKTGWEVTSFSSQETSGEGTNGRAAQIIDGSTSTYWHSAWQSGSASFPHWFIIDMKQQYTLSGIQFNLSGGTSRHQKSIEILAGDDGKNFHSVYVNTACPDAEQYYLKFDSTFKARYFKLVIKSSQSGVVHTRINELQLTHSLDSVVDGITPATRSENSFIAYGSKGGNLNIVMPTDARESKVELFGMGGERVYSQFLYNRVAGEIATMIIPAGLHGLYIVRCTIAGKQYKHYIIAR